MELLRLVQGSDEWKRVRLEHFTASEAPVMMGVAPYMSRDDLLAYKTTQIEEEVGRFQQLIYDKGHALEEKARAIVEAELGDSLFTVTGSKEIDGLPLLGSFDGLNMLHDTAFEHKQWNAEKAAKMQESNELLPEYVYQCEQLLMVSGAEKAIFVMSDGTTDKRIVIEYLPNEETRKQLIAGWHQFKADLEGYVPKIYEPKPEAEVIPSLPALSVELFGQVKGSNLETYKQTALSFIENIQTDLSTDQDFANAEATVKFCERAEKDLESAKERALAQTADIAQLFNAIDELKEGLRGKRLNLSKSIDTQKKLRRQNLVMTANEAVRKHVDKLNEELAGKCQQFSRVQLPVPQSGAAETIKGKRSLKMMEEALNDYVASTKAAITIASQDVASNLETLVELGGGHEFLFNDLQSIAFKAPDDFELLVVNRVETYKREEEERRAQAAVVTQPSAQVVNEPDTSSKTINTPRSIQANSSIEESIEASSDMLQEIEKYLRHECGASQKASKKIAQALASNEVPYCQLSTRTAKAA